MFSQHTSRRDFLFIVCASVSWGTVGVANQALYGSGATNALSLTFLRLAIATPLFFLASWISLGRRLFHIKRRDLSTDDAYGKYDSALSALLRCGHFLCWRECLDPHCHLRCSSAHSAALGPHSTGAPYSDDTHRPSSCSQWDGPPGRYSFSIWWRKRLTLRGIARVSLGLRLCRIRLLWTIAHQQLSSTTNQLRVIRDRGTPSPCLCFINQTSARVSSGRVADVALSGVCSHGPWLWALSDRHSFTVRDHGEYRDHV